MSYHKRVTQIIYLSWLQLHFGHTTCGLPHNLVGKVPHDGKHQGVGGGNDQLGATGGEGEENSGREDKEEHKGVEKHNPVHVLFVLYTLNR